MAERYQILEESQSAHCCFEATVIDTQRPQLIRNEPFVLDGVPQYHAVCECFDLADAEMICKALNEMEARNANR